MTNYGFGPDLGFLPRPEKRKVFISYHHKGDQTWADSFKTLFGETYDVFYDRSLPTPINSLDLQYVDRRIREDYITGTSVTIVLCGAETWKRKCVDWEIYATLEKGHGLLGIRLPTNQQFYKNGGLVSTVPNRLHVNVQNGYAYYRDWTTNAKVLKAAIEVAISNSSLFEADNSQEKMARNLT